MEKEHYLNLIRMQLGATIGDLKNHKRFDMSGYESKKGECTKHNSGVLMTFAETGIFDYVDFLTVDFYKGEGSIYFKYVNSSEIKIINVNGLGTCEIIYKIFQITIFSNRKEKRRRL